LKIGQYLVKLRRMKLKRTKKCANFSEPPCTYAVRNWADRSVVDTTV